MPTVPSTCVRLDFQSLPEVAGFAEANMLSPDECTTSPTPDPDMDDMVLVAVDQGNAVSQDTVPRPPSHKPRIDLGNLNLHSPSSIVGTPFDIEPRFEYPFPPASCSPPFPSIYDFDPGVPSFPGLAAHAVALMPTSVPLPPISAVTHTKTRGEFRSFSPTHLKLQARTPPVPPSLVKKRKLTAKHNTADAAVTRPTAGRPRAGSLSDLPEHLAQDQVRGREEDSSVERFDTERDRSHSLDLTRKRAPLERVRSDVTAVDSEGDSLDSKPSLLHASSSDTLATEFDASEKLAEECLRSESPSSMLSPAEPSPL